MDIIEYILIFTNWNVVGFIIALTSMDSTGFEYVNPCWIYRHYHVIYFALLLLFVIGFIKFVLLEDKRLIMDNEPPHNIEFN